MNWQTIFQQSKVNGAPYLGDALPHQNWKWPKNTWLQRRLRDLRVGERSLEKDENGMAYQRN
jgi:hypothetical protein